MRRKVGRRLGEPDALGTLGQDMPSVYAVIDSEPLA
jgi:hypothetical protein